MKYITKSQVDEVIEVLNNKCKPLPITIGRVLELMLLKLNMGTINHWNPRMTEVCQLWLPCGIQKPLQTLLECGWEERCSYCNDVLIIGCSCTRDGAGGRSGKPREQLKSPQVNDLLIYIYNLFIKK